jgi:hypothetical protein
MSPATWDTGEASIRHVLANMIGPSAGQKAALKAGLPVVLERELLDMFSHSAMPANLADVPLWRLDGANDLTPVS